MSPELSSMLVSSERHGTPHYSGPARFQTMPSSSIITESQRIRRRRSLSRWCMERDVGSSGGDFSGESLQTGFSKIPRLVWSRWK